jgi:two-component system chemotaxis sensor kinase CheA
MKKSNFFILCFDDEPDVLEVVGELVSTMGYGYKSFSDPDEGVAWLKKNSQKVFLILSDFRMPNCDGFQVKQMVDKVSKTIPFLIFTGFWNKEMAQKAMEIGVVGFIEKPLDEKVLEEYIQKYGESRLSIMEEESQMVEEFLDETTPMLDEIEALILELEEKENDDYTLSVYFRLLHTIKGTAACIGLENLSGYTHKYEDFISAIRNGSIKASTESTNILLKGLDELRSLFEYTSENLNDYEYEIEEKVKIFSGDFKADENSAPNETKVIREVNASETPAASASDKKKAPQDEKMSVSLELLNTFMEESGELTVVRNSILKTVKLIEQKYRGDTDIELLNDLLVGMHSVTSKIQNKIIEMRKIPLSTVFRPFKRLIRDLSKQLNKKIELELVGDDLYVDTKVAKLFSQTLIHLIRNSIDHGIEDPETRVKAGKTDKGIVTIEALEHGEDIILKVIDNGKGIDPEIISEKAIEKGLLTKEELSKMSDIEIKNLIFHSGFSTAQTVSDISGRGVGMDMVKGSFEQMGGGIYVDSIKGEGSTFHMRVPIPKSVLIINSLLVECGKRIFTFPMDEVAEVLRVGEFEEKVFQQNGAFFLNHNESLVKLIYLQDVVDETYTKLDKSEIDNIVILKVGTNFVGVIVDDIFEFEEVVIRKMPKAINAHNLFLGVALLGSGSMGMILSSDGLCDYCKIDYDSEHQKWLNDQKVDHVDEGVDYLKFQTFSDNAFVVSLENVNRLEKSNTSKINSSGSKYFINYNNKVLPVVDINKLLKLSEEDCVFKAMTGAKDNTDKAMELLIISHEEREIALLVRSVDEIYNVSEDADESTIDREGLLGSLFINGETVCELDVEYIFKTYFRTYSAHTNKISVA